MSTRVIKVRTKKQTAAAAAEGARALKAGKLVGFATETVYGIAAVAGCGDAMRRLRELKSRPKRPFTVHLGRCEDTRRYVCDMPPEAQRLIVRSWPGPVTLLVPVGGRLADAKLQKAGLYELLCRRDIIGLRCPDAPVASAMLSAVKAPVVAPSANRPRAPSPRTADEVLEALDGQIDLLIDSGPTRYGKDSTIVRCDAGGWKIVRPGAYDARTIRRLLKQKLLFVCTGNTCRSPIAAGLARKMLADRMGCRVSQLGARGVDVISAGFFSGGGRATHEAVSTVRALGTDISRHRSQKLTAELIISSDMVFCMTDFHVAEAGRIAPDSADKIRRLDESADVPDPIGGGPKVYRKIAEQIAGALKRLADKGLL